MPDYDIEFQLMVNGRVNIKAANMEAAEKRVRGMNMEDLESLSFEFEKEFESVDVSHANF